MLITSDDELEVAMKRCEDARGLLENALKTYMDSCVSLESNICLGRGHKASTDIVSRIDSVLGYLQNTVIEQLTQCRSTVSRIRNKLASSIRYLPEEIMEDVFFHVIYSPDNYSLPMPKCVRSMYSELRNIMLVCSTWRALAISQSILWEIIPIFGKSSNIRAIDINLPRAGSRGVRLATVVPWGGIAPHLVDKITQHIHRFRAISVEAEDHDDMFDFIRRLVHGGSPTRLSELSIRYSKSKESNIVLPESVYGIGFDKWIQSLSVLLLDRIQMPWQNALFSDRLVELAVHRVRLDNSESSMTTFIAAISSATRLRDLSIAGVEVYEQSTKAFNLATPPMSLFPNLQHLSLLDLRCNVLESLLYKIKPGSYHLTLVLTDNAVQIMTEEDPEMFVIVDRLALLLSQTRVNTLVFVRGHSTLGPWLEGSELRTLLKSASGLEELGIHGWRFDEPFCLGLIPPSNPTTKSNTSVFPSLNKLYLTDLKILDVERFKHILSSVSSRSIVIWGGSRAGELSMGALHVNEEFKDWLTCNVPAARLVSSGVYPDAMKVKEWTY